MFQITEVLNNSKKVYRFIKINDEKKFMKINKGVHAAKISDYTSYLKFCAED